MLIVPTHLLTTHLLICIRRILRYFSRPPGFILLVRDRRNHLAAASRRSAARSSFAAGWSLCGGLSWRSRSDWRFALPVQVSRMTAEKAIPTDRPAIKGRVTVREQMIRRPIERLTAKSRAKKSGMAKNTATRVVRNRRATKQRAAILPAPNAVAEEPQRDQHDTAITADRHMARKGQTEDVWGPAQGMGIMVEERWDGGRWGIEADVE
jgi:hypothetical protein